MRVLPRLSVSIALVCLTLGGAATNAQPPPGFQPPVPRSPRESAQLDITGYWVALVTEDWLWRMVTPQKGDVTSVPVNPRGRQAANEWDLERDIANGEECRAYGAAGLLRLPLRLHVTWEDDATLRIDTDAGEQTRLLHFASDSAAPQEPTWQGNSIAAWTRAVGGFDLRMVFGSPNDVQQGPIKASLKVVTEHLRPGYLRKNGVPYSEQTQLTEYFSTVQAAGNEYLTVLTVVRDPVYLSGAFVTSSQFRKEADAAHWDPSPCHTAQPLPTTTAGGE